jgi:hypothetical protein
MPFAEKTPRKGRFSAHAKHELQDQGKQKGTNRASWRILADL